MIPVKRDMTPKEQKRYRRLEYETEKKGLIAFFNKQKYEKKYLHDFLVNSLKGFEEELKEDGLL